MSLLHAPDILILKKHLKTSNQTVSPESHGTSEVAIYLFPLACGSGKDGMMPTRALSHADKITVLELFGALARNEDRKVWMTYMQLWWLWMTMEIFGYMNHTLFGTISRTHDKLWLAMFYRGRIQTTMGNGTICRYYIAAWCNVWPPR